MTFALAHALSIRFVVMVITQNVQDSVRNEQRNLVVEAASMTGGLFVGHTGANDDITNEQRQFSSIDSRHHR